MGDTKGKYACYFCDETFTLLEEATRHFEATHRSEDEHWATKYKSPENICMSCGHARDSHLPEPDGEHYYPVKDEVFKKTYDPESVDPNDDAAFYARTEEPALLLFLTLVNGVHALGYTSPIPERYPPNRNIPEAVTKLRESIERAKALLDLLGAEP